MVSICVWRKKLTCLSAFSFELVDVDILFQVLSRWEKKSYILLYNMIWLVRILWLIEFSDHACSIFSRNLFVIHTCLIVLRLLSLFPLAINASFTTVTFVSPQSMAINPVCVDVSCLIRIWGWCH